MYWWNIGIFEHRFKNYDFECMSHGWVTRTSKYKRTHIIKLHSLQHRFHKNIFMFLFLNTREIETFIVDAKFKTTGVEAIEIDTLACVASRAFRRDRTFISLLKCPKFSRSVFFRFCFIHMYSWTFSRLLLLSSTTIRTFSLTAKSKV